MQGCTSIYAPNTIPSPLLRQSGQMITSLHFGPAGAEVQAAAAVTERVGIGAALSYKNPDWMGSRAREGYGEGMIGYSEQPGRTTMIGIFAGAGTGSSAIPADFDSGTDFSKVFVQGTFAFVPALTPDSVRAQSLEGGFLVRLSRVSFSNSRMGDTAALFEPGLYIEPGLFLRQYSENIGIGAQVSTMRLLGTKPPYSYPSFCFAVSFLARFSL